MNAELHIHLHADVINPPEDILAGFPFESGQNILTYGGGVIIVGLGDADDTNYVQDWFLENNEDVESFYVVGD